MNSELVRSWKDPDSRSGDPVAHPAGAIAMDLGFGAGGAQAESLITFTLTIQYECYSAFNGTCVFEGSVGCCEQQT